jgi:hypothetical protein
MTNWTEVLNHSIYMNKNFAKLDPVSASKLYIDSWRGKYAVYNKLNVRKW